MGPGIHHRWISHNVDLKKKSAGSMTGSLSKIDTMDDSALKEREEILSIAEAYVAQNLYKEALHIAESWLKRYPIDADVNIIRCHALLRMGDLEKVNDILDGVENTVRQLSRIYNRVGDLCLNGGLTQEAVKYYRKFVALNPDSPIAENVSEKINALVSTEDYISTRSDDDRYNNIDHVASDFYTTTLAELYVRQGHPDMAADVLSEILKKDPGNQLVANRLKDIRAMQNDGTKEKTSFHVSQNKAVIQELTRWLKNIDTLKSYAS
jgi:tetratricopeptide (TPR) repeat protein